MQIIFRIFKTETKAIRYYTGQVIFIEDGTLNKIQDYWKLKKLNIFPKIHKNSNIIFGSKEELYDTFKQKLNHYLKFAEKYGDVSKIYVISETNKIYSKSIIDKDYPVLLSKINYNF